jgi:hypothetical protein
LPLRRLTVLDHSRLEAGLRGAWQVDCIWRLVNVCQVVSFKLMFAIIS